MPAPCYMCAMRSAVDRIIEPGHLTHLAWIWFFTDRRWCKSLAKLTKQVKIEKSKLFFVNPKTILVIPYPYNFSISYPLSLKLFCQLSLIPKTPNRASVLHASCFSKWRIRFQWASEHSSQRYILHNATIKNDRNGHRRTTLCVCVYERKSMRVMNKALNLAHLNHSCMVFFRLLGPSKASYSEITFGRWRLRQERETRLAT